MVPPFAPEHIGHIGEVESLGEFYHRRPACRDLPEPRSHIASKPYVTCRACRQGLCGTSGGVSCAASTVLPTLAPVHFSADSSGLYLRECGREKFISGAKRGDYTITLSLIAPHVRLMNDGKTPFCWEDFADGISKALQKATGAAYRAMIRPPYGTFSLKDAAWGGHGGSQTLRQATTANCRPMYAPNHVCGCVSGYLDTYRAPTSLRTRTSRKILLPDYMGRVSRRDCRLGCCVRCPRAFRVEPHTLAGACRFGTIEVRNYLGDRAD